MSDFVTQSQWAEQAGVSVRTFRRWRAAGRIPLPDVDLPGVPRWTFGLVARTTAKLRVKDAIAFGQKGHAFRNRAEQRPNRDQFRPVSRRHGADSIPQDDMASPLHSMERR